METKLQSQSISTQLRDWLQGIYKTYYDGIYAPIAKGVTGGDAHTHAYVDSAGSATLATSLQRATISHNAAQSIPNNSWTTIAFNTDVSDPYSFHDPVANAAYIYLPTGEALAICQNFAFAAHATGVRGVRIYDTLGNGWSSKLVPALNGFDTQFDLVAQRSTTAGQPIYVQVFQNSGGPLNLQAFPKVSVSRVG